MLSVIIPVYRNARSALDLVAIIGHQLFPAGCPLEVIAVDDGSGDGTQAELNAANVDELRVIALPDNSGRAAARNAGAAQARGEHLVFIDCDCRPVGERFLASHLEFLKRNCVACTGPLAGVGSGFWRRYQDEASCRRAQQHARGVPFAGTTANFSVCAHAFREAGGFDPRYTRYGFEDRDLLIRLSRLGRIGWCADATVQHVDQVALPGVVAKLHQAGGSSALRFSQDHPDAYRALGYAAIDTRQHRWLRPIGWASRPLVRCAGKLERILDSRWLPYSVARSTVKVLGALAFMQGSMTKITD